MDTQRKLSTLALVSALSIGSLGLAFPALASAAGACSGNRTCTYDGRYTDFLGSRTPGTTLQNISAGNRNKLTSWINYSNTGSRFYYSTNGNGTCVPMYANDRAAASSSNPDNNQAESWAFTRIC